MEKDNEYLVDIQLNLGDIDKVMFESKEQKTDFINRYGLGELYGKSRGYKIEAYYAGDPVTRNNFSAMLEDKNETITKVVDSVLAGRGVKVPTLLNNEEKINTVINELKEIGINDREIDTLLKNGIGKTGKNEEEIALTFSDTAETRKTLTAHGIQFAGTKDGLKVDAKMLLKEGFEVEDNAKNRKILEDNEIAYSLKAGKERKLFVPLRAKKVAALILLSLAVGPIPGIILQIAMNQSGLSDKMFDRHLISPSQKAALKNGMTVKARQRENGKNVEQYLYKDRVTGKINRVNVNDVNVPSQVNGIKLTPAQAKSLKDGKTVDVLDKNGVPMAFRIDMNAENGIKALYKEMRSDREFKNVPKPESPDIDKLKYIGLKGTQGINDIYGGGGTSLERDGFLLKFGLKKDFNESLSLQKDLKIAEMYGKATSSMIEAVSEKSGKIKDSVLDLLVGESVSRKR